MSIQKRTNPSGKISWRVRLYDPNLKRSVTVGTYRTKGEARDAEADAIAARTLPNASTITVSEWRELWIKTSKVKMSTKAWHRERTNSFVKDYGDRRMSSIDRMLALDWAVDHPSTVQALSAMWTAAGKADLHVGQPWRGLVPQYRRRITPGWLTEHDIMAMVDAAYASWTGAYGQCVAALIVTGAYAGLRPGELAALRWQDLDAAAGRIRVEQQAESRTRTFTTPKNGEARTVVYAPIVQRYIAAAPRLHDELVFVGPGNGILWGAARDRIWHPVRVRVGRPKMALHELRHWCATWLVEQGLSTSDVAIQLGHTDGGRLVETTYGHARPDPALDRLAAALNTAGQHGAGSQPKEKRAS